MSTQLDPLRETLLEQRDEVARILLTSKQVRVVKLIRRFQPVDSSEVAQWLNTSTSNACRYLVALLDKGYLKRTDVNDTSGGRHYMYSIATAGVAQ